MSRRRGGVLRTAPELRQLADELVHAVLVLTKLNKLPELDTQESILVKITSRFQPYIQNRWRKLVLEMKRERGFYPDLEIFVEFVTGVATEVNDPVYGKLNVKKSDSRNKLSHFQTAAKQQNHNRSQEPPCVLCSEKHRLWYCQQFKGMKINERRELVTRCQMWENCLLRNHSTKIRQKPSVCSVPDCGQKHTKFLHQPRETPEFIMFLLVVLPNLKANHLTTKFTRDQT